MYGRKERDNPFGLSITAIYLCVYVSPYLQIHPRPFFFFFFFNFLFFSLCLNSESLFGLKLSSFVSLFYFSYKGHQRLLPSSVWLISLSIWSFKVHPPSNQWRNFIISVMPFHGWVITHRLSYDSDPCLFCVPYFTQNDHLYFRSCAVPWHYFLLLYGWEILHCVHVSIVCINSTVLLQLAWFSVLAIVP